MTGDEAFIRAIVDSPGDDTPRLVYADWLDERDDSRGLYLRAEVEWAEPWRNGERLEYYDAEDMRELAERLDPLWVARITRPPAGVCCDHLKMKKSRFTLTTEDIDSVEQRFAISFPVEYRAFLLNYNGGGAKRYERLFSHEEGCFWNGCYWEGQHQRDGTVEYQKRSYTHLEGLYWELQPWIRLYPQEGGTRYWCLVGEMEYWRSANNPLLDVIPLCHANTGLYSSFMIGHDNSNRGKIYTAGTRSLNSHAANPRVTADSLGLFLASVREQEKPSEADPDEETDS